MSRSGNARSVKFSRQQYTPMVRLFMANRVSAQICLLSILAAKKARATLGVLVAFALTGNVRGAAAESTDDLSKNCQPISALPPPYKLEDKGFDARLEFDSVMGWRAMCAARRVFGMLACAGIALVAISGPVRGDIVTWVAPVCKTIAPNSRWMTRDGQVLPWSVDNIGATISDEDLVDPTAPSKEGYTRGLEARRRNWVPTAFETEAVRLWFKDHAPAGLDRVGVVPTYSVFGPRRVPTGHSSPIIPIKVDGILVNDEMPAGSPRFMLLFPELPCVGECTGTIAYRESPKAMIGFRPFVYRQRYIKHDLILYRGSRSTWVKGDGEQRSRDPWHPSIVRGSDAYFVLGPDGDVLGLTSLWQWVLGPKVLGTKKPPRFFGARITPVIKPFDPPLACLMAPAGEDFRVRNR